MHRRAERPLATLGRRKRCGGEFVAIAAEDDDAYAVAASAYVPYGFEDGLALVEVAGPLRDFAVSIALLGWTHEV